MAKQKRSIFVRSQVVEDTKPVTNSSTVRMHMASRIVAGMLANTRTCKNLKDDEIVGRALAITDALLAKK